MRAVVVRTHGGPDVLIPVRRPDPRPKPDEVLVRNEFIGVNYVDLQHRAGIPYPVPLPLVPGIEAAGTVVEVGPGVRDVRVGQRVVHFGHMCGVYADLTAVPIEFVVPLSAEVPLDLAAAVALQGTTAHVLTRLATRVGPDDVVVVHAAAGGSGSAVASQAAAAGADVIGVVSTPAKVEHAHAAGCRQVVVAGTDLAETIRAATGGRGADVVFDAGGADTLDISINVLADFGTLVLYGQSSGSGGMLDVARLSGLTGSDPGGSLTVKWVAAGHYLRPRSERVRAMNAVLGDVAAGVLRPRMAARLPLDMAWEAHEMLEDRNTAGKILLTV